MAKYTITLKDLSTLVGQETILRWFSDYDLDDYLTPEQQAVLNNNGLWSKEKLAKKIYRHYFFREIGFETPAIFAEQTKIYLEELMEEYLPLIYSVAIKYDPLVNVDFTETYKHTENQVGDSHSTSQNDGSGLTINSDTPQGNINKNDILSGQYATSTQGTENTNSIVDNTNTNSAGESEYIKNVKGNSGVSATAQKMIEQYRNNVKAYDREIINNLSELFMGVY